MSNTKKKIKKRGDSVILRTKKNEPNFIIDWLNNQSNISESLRHLIEKDVAENGIRDVNYEILNKHAYVSNRNRFNYKENEQKQSIVEVSQKSIPNQQVVNTPPNIVKIDTNSISEQDSPGTEQQIELEPSIEVVLENDAENNTSKKNSPDEPKTEQIDGRKVKKRNIDLSAW